MANGPLPAKAGVYQCKACERHLEANAFYASNLTRCKECVKEGVRANRAAKIDYYRSYDRARYREDPERQEAARKSAASEAGLAARKRYAERMRGTPEMKARNAVKNAIRDGKLARGTSCYFCNGAENLQAHHHDYSRPLDVFWLCASCHGKLHVINGDFLRSNRERQA